jgi:hypothetical protein
MRGANSLRAALAVLSIGIQAATAGQRASAQGTVLPDAPIPELRTAAQAAPFMAAQGAPADPTPPASSSGIVFRPAQPPCGAETMSGAAEPRMSCWPDANPFQRFLNAGPARPLTARQKFHLAARNVYDPFNLLTIVGDAAISVASDPDSHYGPGMLGFAKYSGVSLTQDMTAEFFVTALVPSITHQDPHYHRMPNASYTRRIVHCITQPVWAQGDSGKPMPNYAYIFGITAADTISNIYVPGREQGTWPTAARVAVALGSAPIDNFITEFLPDVARHVSIRIVLIQRVINHVALQDGTE